MATEPPPLPNNEEKIAQLKQLTSQENVAHLIQLTFPENEKWARIFKAFCYVYAVAAVVLYFLGISNVWATKVVYYAWKLNPFGILWGDVPYICGPFGTPAGNQICTLGFGADGLDLSHASYGYQFHFSFFFFILGGLISLRVVVFCLDRLEAAMGVDFLSRVIEKFLPAKRTD
jgi:hypothetical protein